MVKQPTLIDAIPHFHAWLELYWAPAVFPRSKSEFTWKEKLRRMLKGLYNDICYLLTKL